MFGEKMFVLSFIWSAIRFCNSLYLLISDRCLALSRNRSIMTRGIAMGDHLERQSMNVETPLRGGLCDLSRAAVSVSRCFLPAFQFYIHNWPFMLSHNYLSNSHFFCTPPETILNISTCRCFSSGRHEPFNSIYALSFSLNKFSLFLHALEQVAAYSFQAFPSLFSLLMPNRIFST